MSVDSEPLVFDCPRCARASSAFTYGPCPDCRRQLQARMGREGRAIPVEGYEPKMNVAPNQVATKD